MKTIKEHTLDENKIMANFYETSYNYNILLLNKLIDNEPLKIFKKRHKKWEEEKDILNDKVNESFNKLNSTYKSIEDTI
ncbi:MAG: hypothetical protein IJ105_03080 [Bacilli bacterium]|nr:hypothetical protein [Bacilli bacterium]